MERPQIPNLGAEIEGINTPQRVYLAHDHFMALQGQVWEDLDSSLRAGLCSESEAIEAYVDWHNIYTDLSRQVS